VYKLPIYLRKFYLKELIDLKKKEKQQVEKAQKASSKRPSVNPIIKR
jgi:hypothetical protein